MDNIIIPIFIILQIILLFFVIFHNLIYLSQPVGMFKSRKFGQLINSIFFVCMVLIPLFLTVLYYLLAYSFFALTIIATFYVILTVGTMFSWWLPYFYGSSFKICKKNSLKYYDIIYNLLFMCFLVWIYQSKCSFFILFIYYGIFLVGTIFSWKIPYFLGGFSVCHQYHNTRYFLPCRGDNIVPDTFHIIFHVQIWVCFFIALYLSFGK